MVKEKGFSILLFFMVIIAIELISLGGVFAYQYYSKIPNSQLPISNESSNPQNSDTKTAGWEAYSGYGIFFKYPKEMGQPTVNQLSTKVSISFNQGAIEFDVGAYYNQELGRNMTLDEVVNSAVMHPNIINITRKNIIMKMVIYLWHMNTVELLQIPAESAFSKLCQPLNLYHNRTKPPDLP